MPNNILAEGFENRAKSKPVIIAKPSEPITDSKVTMILAKLFPGSKPL